MLKKESDEVNRMFQAKCLAFIRFFNACFVLVSYVKLRLLSSRFQVVSPNVVCNRNTNQIDEVQSMSRSEFYKSRAGAEGFKSFFQFLSLPPKTQKFPKYTTEREKRKRSLSNKLQSQESKMRTKRLSFEKSEALFFSVEGLKRSKSLNEEFVMKWNSERPFEHPQSFSRALGKRSDRSVSCISTVNIYICLYIFDICVFLFLPWR